MKPRAVVLVILLAPASVTAALYAWAAVDIPAPVSLMVVPDPTADAVAACVNGAAVLPHAGPGPRVAAVMPTFTLTPYTNFNFNRSFYAFYARHATGRGPWREDVALLSTRVTTNWSSPLVNDEKPLFDFLAGPVAQRCGLRAGENLRFVDDRAVDAGALFHNGIRSFDVVILGHEEYVTAREFASFEAFVLGGGRIVAMSGNTFYAEVAFNRTTQTVQLVKGHGFAFNGSVAFHSNDRPFDSAAVRWFGSRFADRTYGLRGAYIENTTQLGRALRHYFGAVAFKDYTYGHDETNRADGLRRSEIVASFVYAIKFSAGHPIMRLPNQPVRAYVHRAGNGSIACLCIFGENIIAHDRAAQFFLVYAVLEGVVPGAPRTTTGGP
ncbi:MAG: N,N-dimethylformamidase beta subunit family domain-containing protein [Thermoplasmatota archaeon]